MIDTSSRISGIREYYFSGKLREIEQMNQTGEKVINLGIGSPDLPPHPSVVTALSREAVRNNTHAYQSYKGSPVLRKAAAEWYGKWYGVELDPETEILPLIGSKEGIMHVCMTYINEGDEVLIPNPGYPTYKSAAMLAGATVKTYELAEEESWQPNFETLEQQDLSKVKIMFVNYPHMPTGTLPTRDLFEKIIDFGRRNQILICHDNPYSFILPGFGQKNHPSSILSIPGAKEVAVELNSLSKSHNMAGWRVGFLCGKASAVNDIMRFKSNMDSGMFLPLQVAAAEALALPESWYTSLNEVYEARRKKACEILDLLKCTYVREQAGLFMWALIPQGYEDAYVLTDKILYESRVFITPGGIFGDAGNRFIRISLCANEETLEAAKNKIASALKIGKQ